MIPQIIVSSDSKKTDDFVSDYIKQNQVSPNYVFEIRPRTKEISIEQIREIKKGIVYENTQNRLFVIHEFDTASYEAQNAFLKTLEEHADSLHFLLLVKNHRGLAPTIISRSKVVVLDKDEGGELDHKFNEKLGEFIENSSLKALDDKVFNPKEYDLPEDLFGHFIGFFRARIKEDKKATDIIRETLRLQNLVENNNVDPQNAVDYLLIHIGKTYS